jgi:hypothetical protein
VATAIIVTVSAHLAQKQFASAIPKTLSMAEIVNLRTARKRAERSKAESRAAENRQAHGAPKRDRAGAEADRKKLNQILDSHRIEPGDRR